MIGQVELTPSNIIMSDPHITDEDREALEQYLPQLIEDGRAVGIRKNNSVLLLILIAEKQAEVHLYTIDDPIRLSSAVEEFIKQLKSSALTKIYSNMAPETPKLFKLMEKHGLIAEDSDRPEYDWMANV